MGTLPILLKNPSIILIGGGQVALQKAQVLADNNIDFSVIAAKICREIVELDIPIKIKKLDLNDLDTAHIVIDATGNPAVAQLILKQKEQQNILFNCVDQPDLCDFYFCSLLSYGNLKIAVSTEGSSPTVGQVVRDEIAAIIPEGIEQLLEEKRRERRQGIIDVSTTKEQCRSLFKAHKS